jgi:hypothetical protein
MHQEEEMAANALPDAKTAPAATAAPTPYQPALGTPDRLRQMADRGIAGSSASVLILL